MALPVIDPIPPRKIAGPVDHPEFIWEVKHDGWRALFYRDRAAGTAQFVSRNGRVLARFQPVADALAKQLHISDIILDGELVVLDETGKSHFNELSRRDARVSFYAFDMPWSGGTDKRDHPLSSRKNAMRAMFSSGTDHMVIGDHVVGAGVALFEAICARDCEGVVGKWLPSPYRMVGTKSPWVKVLNPDYTQKRGRAEAFNRRR